MERPVPTPRRCSDDGMRHDGAAVAQNQIVAEPADRRPQCRGVLVGAGRGTHGRRLGPARRSEAVNIVDLIPVEIRACTIASGDLV